MKNNKTIILAFIAVALFVSAYFPVFLILGKKWLNSEEYSHGFLILPIIFYMAYTKRHIIKAQNVRFSTFGLVMLVLSSLFYLFALVTQVHTIISLAMLATLLGAIIFVGGINTIKVLFTPLLLFALLIPIPDQLYINLTFPLQLKSSQISEFAIRLFDIPILREGNIMTIPGKTFEVVEACSGLHSIITLLTLSIVMGFFLLSNNFSKLLLLVVSVPTAIIVNVIRIVVMILMFHLFQIDLLEGPMHTLMGLFIFLIGLFILFAVQWGLLKWEKKSTQN